MKLILIFKLVISIGVVVCTGVVVVSDWLVVLATKSKSVVSVTGSRSPEVAGKVTVCSVTVVAEVVVSSSPEPPDPEIVSGASNDLLV